MLTSQQAWKRLFNRIRLKAEQDVRFYGMKCAGIYFICVFSERIGIAKWLVSASSEVNCHDSSKPWTWNFFQQVCCSLVHHYEWDLSALGYGGVVRVMFPFSFLNLHTNSTTLPFIVPRLRAIHCQTFFLPTNSMYLLVFEEASSYMSLSLESRW